MRSQVGARSSMTGTVVPISYGTIKLQLYQWGCHCFNPVSFLGLPLLGRALGSL